jgi:hypothetical protein
MSSLWDGGALGALNSPTRVKVLLVPTLEYTGSQFRGPCPPSVYFSLVFWLKKLLVAVVLRTR